MEKSGFQKNQSIEELIEEEEDDDNILNEIV
jgi:hypothetical protein